MKEITGFLQFVAEGNEAKAKEHFEAAMAEKVSKTLDARKVAVAHKHFNEETLEEAVVTRTLKTTFKYKSTPDVVVSKVHSGKDEKDLTKNYKKWEKLALDIAGKNEHGDKPIKVEVDAVKESVDASAESLEERNKHSRYDTDTGKRLEIYAKKNGGIDKADMLKVAKMLQAGDDDKAWEYASTLDTHPREYILSLIDSDRLRRMGESTSGESLEEAKVIKAKEKVPFQSGRLKSEVPVGASLTPATNLPADAGIDFWATWDGMTDEEESWERNYGFGVTAAEAGVKNWRK